MYNDDMKRVSLIIPLILVFSFLISGIQTVFAQDFDELYVPETGHWIRGKFLDYYRSVDDPAFYFGHPITDEFTDSLNGRPTQYFERARFDLMSDGYKTFVKRAPLGELLYERGKSDLDINQNPSSCEYFLDTDKYVCHAFLEFYAEHQREKILGLPISNIEWQEGRFVQYFEFARVEWHPASKSGRRVVLSDLGKDYFNTRLGDPAFLDPNSPSALRAINVSLAVDIFVQQPLISNGHSQKIYFIVRNQHNVPVQDVMIKVTLIRDDEKLDIYRPNPTDENGVSTLTFTLSDMKPNEIIKIQVEAELGDLSNNANGWFRCWW